MTKPDRWVREPAVAGKFYPADKAALNGTLDELFCDVPSKATKARVLLVPHAGYIYSGKIAAIGYRQTPIPRSVILLCPNHTGEGPAVSVWGKGAWSTPLGEVPIDESLATSLMHRWGTQPDQEAHRFEHAIEVHLPFLQRLKPEVQIVPVTLGRLGLDRCLDLGRVLGQLMVEFAEVLVIVSTDMSHYVPATVAKRQDELALRNVEQVSPEGLYRTVVQDEISMCGFIPSVIALSAAKVLGLTQGHRLAYGHSGETSGDTRSVVGYAALSI